MAALGGLVTEVDADSPAAQAEQAEAVKAEAKADVEAKAWAVIPLTVGKLVCMIAPELAEIYSDDSCQAWGEAMVPVADKYGWSGPSGLPEMALLIASASFAVPTYFVVGAKLKAMREAKQKHEADRTVDAVVSPSPAAGMAAGGDGG